MRLAEVFSDQRTEKEYYNALRTDLFTARTAISKNGSCIIRSDLPFVRIFLPPDIEQNHRFDHHLSLVLDGGVYVGYPKFGAYDVVSAGWEKTQNGSECPYIDLYPAERIEEQPDLTPGQICDNILHETRLMAQFKTWGVREVQTSNGLFVNFEEAIRVKALDQKPVAGSNISRPQQASEPTPKA